MRYDFSKIYRVNNSIASKTENGGKMRTKKTAIVLSLLLLTIIACTRGEDTSSDIPEEPASSDAEKPSALLVPPSEDVLPAENIIYIGAFRLPGGEYLRQEESPLQQRRNESDEDSR